MFKKLLTGITLLLITCSAFAVDVTFQVDMSGQTVNGSVYVSGWELDRWNGGWLEMTDPNLDNIYTKTVKLNPGVYHYKYLNGSWNGAEGLTNSNGDYCLVNSGGFTNRFIVIGSQDTIIPVNCFDECRACAATGTPPKVDVTFQVDMSNENVTGPVYLTGNTVDNWCGTCVPMSDVNNDDIYELTFSLDPGSHEFKFVNGGWNNGEDFTSTGSCHVENFGFINRIVYVPMGSGPMVLDVAPFNACANPEVNITLRVDMTDQTVSPAGVHLSGSHNNWTPALTPMEDIGNGYWETVLRMKAGEGFQYKFVNGDQTADEETVPAACVDPIPDLFENRYLLIPDQNKLVYTVCYGECGPCDDNLVLSWADEFNGTTVDPGKWNFEVGNNGGWGNNELQYYTANPGNVDIDNGNLVITAKEENAGVYNYTSTRMTTKDKGDFKFGRIEARVKLPKGQGIWPAFWMMPTQSVYGGWPTSGEIDIMELVGHEPDRVHGTLHFGPAPGSGHVYMGDHYDLNGADFADDFHVFTVEYEAHEIRWFVDSIQFNALTPRDICPWNWPFDQEFFLILNVAVGGNWPGAPNSSTQFPQTMEVDWIRVYQENGVSRDQQEMDPLKGIQVFPNPTTEEINLYGEGINTPLNIHLIDMQGKEWITHLAMDIQQPISLKKLPAGIYLLKIETESHTEFKRVVKK